MLQNLIFQVDGGLGKSIMATAVLKAIRKQYKKANITVVTRF
jgi:ADP-heptose:LPS heptosyltransferase